MLKLPFLVQRESCFYKVLFLVSIGRSLDAASQKMEKIITMEYLSFVTIHGLKEDAVKYERITDQ